MRKLFTFLFMVATMLAHAQYTTPDTGVRWNLDSLVNHSAGVVIHNGTHYEFTANLFVSATDTIDFITNDTAIMHDLTYIETNGVLTIDPPQQMVFTAIDSLSLNKWRGIKFMEGHHTFIRNATFQYGGGLKIISGGSFHIEGCTLKRNFYKSGSTSGSLASSATIDVSGPATILNNSFISNQRGGVGSGANISAPLVIRDNYFFGNVTENSNRPQINVGPAGEGDTTFIIGNTIIGNGFTNSGGIAYASLLGVPGSVVIDSNTVTNNRYGITLTGSPIDGAIRYNTITGNNIQNNPDLGGSGINLTASSTSAYQHCMVTGNTIVDNLWGITIIGYPVVNLGDTTMSNYNPGLNEFSGNGNNGILYDLYNNGPVAQTAMENCWGVSVQDSASIEGVIFHQADNAALGLVTFMPAGCSQVVTFMVTDAQLNPLADATITIQGIPDPLNTGAEGTAMLPLIPGTYNYTVTLAGYLTTSASFTVASQPVQVDVQLYNATYTLTFSVTDGTAPIAGAAINVGGFNINTNASGVANIDLLPGTYSYEVTKTGYLPVADTVIMGTAPYTENVVMTAVIPEYNVTFNVLSDGHPVEGALIYIASDTLVTNPDGVASIMLVNGQYPYLVTAVYNDTVEGIATVNGQDLTLTIGLISGIKATELPNVRIYPNPATSQVNIEGSGILKIELRQLQGNLVRTYNHPAGTLNIQAISAGIYFMHFYTADQVIVKRLIIK